MAWSEVISSHLLRLWGESKLLDVAVICKGKAICSAHRVVLSAFSPILLDRITSSTETISTATEVLKAVELNELNEESIKMLVTCMYTGIIDMTSLTSDQILTLLTDAKYLSIDYVVKLIEEYLSSSKSLQTACEQAALGLSSPGQALKPSLDPVHSDFMQNNFGVAAEAQSVANTDNDVSKQSSAVLDDGCGIAVETVSLDGRRSCDVDKERAVKDDCNVALETPAIDGGDNCAVAAKSISGTEPADNATAMGMPTVAEGVSSTPHCEISVQTDISMAMSQTETIADLSKQNANDRAFDVAILTALYPEACKDEPVPPKRKRGRPRKSESSKTPIKKAQSKLSGVIKSPRSKRRSIKKERIVYDTDDESEQIGDVQLGDETEMGATSSQGETENVTTSEEQNKATSTGLNDLAESAERELPVISDGEESEGAAGAAGEDWDSEADDNSEVAGSEEAVGMSLRQSPLRRRNKLLKNRRNKQIGKAKKSPRSPRKAKYSDEELHSCKQEDGLYKCPECDKAMEWAELKQHVTRRHSGRSLVCTYCGKEFRDRYKLTEHIRVHTNERPFSCEECGRPFKAKKTLNKHMKIHNRTQRLPCTYEGCKKTFSEKGHVERHIRTVHLKLKRFKCDYEGCQYVGCESSDLKAHQRNRHTPQNEKPRVLCNVCGAEVLGGAQGLKIHMIKHSEVTHECPVCNFKTKYKNHLQDHVTRRHGVDAEGRAVEKTLQCPNCPFSCYFKYEFNFHLRKHKEKPYKCQLCDFRALTPFILKVHMRSHTGLKPYLCKYCHKSFAQSTQLVRHTRTHTGEKPHQCIFCEQRFVEKKNLDRHVNNVHVGLKQFMCHMCTYICAKKDTLKNHIRNSHGEEALPEDMRQPKRHIIKVHELPEEQRRMIIDSLEIEETRTRSLPNYETKLEVRRSLEAKAEVRPNVETAKLEARPNFETAKLEARPNFETAKLEARPNFETAKLEARPNFETAKLEVPLSEGVVAPPGPVHKPVISQPAVNPQGNTSQSIDLRTPHCDVSENRVDLGDPRFLMGFYRGIAETSMGQVQGVAYGNSSYGEAGDREAGLRGLLGVQPPWTQHYYTQ